MAVFSANGGALGFDPTRAYDVSDGVFDFREGSMIEGIDGYRYIFQVAASDVAPNTANYPVGGVSEGQGYWERQATYPGDAIADYEAEYPSLLQPYQANITITPNSVTGVANGNAWVRTFVASGNPAFPPYTYAVASGALPTGTTLNATTGATSGTASAAATYNFVISATDDNGNVGYKAYQVVIT